MEVNIRKPLLRVLLSAVVFVIMSILFLALPMSFFDLYPAKHSSQVIAMIFGMLVAYFGTVFASDWLERKLKLR